MLTGRMLVGMTTDSPLLPADVDIQALLEEILSLPVPCQVHPNPGYHRPRAIRTVSHHIWPLGMGGPDVAANKIVTCDTGHFNIHRIMGFLLLGHPLPAYGTTVERAMARRGYDEWVAAGRPGRPVFEVW